MSRKALYLLVVWLITVTAHPTDLHAQFVELPPENESAWYMGNAGELIALVAFDRALIADSVPHGLHLVTLAQLSPGDPQIQEYLVHNPDHAEYGFGLVEIVWQDSFAIDAHSPQWPSDGAVGVWFALANASDADEPRARGISWLSLGFWMGDSTFVAVAHQAGWHFEPADVSYHHRADGSVVGEIRRPDLTVFGSCRPSRVRRRLIESEANIQTIWFPQSEPQRFALITFQGHHERECEQSQWAFSGAHPLGMAHFIYSPGLQDGYDLIGGLYSRP